MTGRRLAAILAGALAAGALAAGWMLFAPTQLGGGTSYAILVGSSMEPGLHRGDLAIVRRSAEYRPGDVVLYESADLGANVLHRIERVERGRFVLKGDNNDFLDPERPTEGQIVGALWVHVPAVGRLSSWLQEPLHAALFIGAATLIVLGGLGAGAAAARRRPRSVASRSVDPVARRPPGRAQPELVVGLIVAFLACAGLAVAAHTRPLAGAESFEGAYAHQGRFAYGADVAANAVYPDGVVGTGEPVFLRLVPRLRVSFDYRLESPRPAQLRGTIRFDARIGDGRGWERTLPLAGERTFSGDSAHVSGTLDLRRIQRIVEDVRKLTDSAQATYTVVLLPRLVAAGRAGSDPIDSTFEPALVFELSGERLQPSVTDGAEGLGPFAPRASVGSTRPVAATIALGPFSPSVAAARKLSLVGLATLLLLGGLVLFRPRRSREEHAMIASRYGDLLVSVRPPAPRWQHVVELADIEALVRIATHHGRMVLHLTEASGHAYVVEEGDSVFRYRVAPPTLHVAQEQPAAARSAPVSAVPVPRLADGALIPGGGGARYRTPRRFGLRRRDVA